MAQGLERKPTWRAVLSSLQSLEADFLERLRHTLWDAGCWGGLDDGCKTVVNCALAFRLICITGAACYEELFLPHGLYPWRTFGMAAGVLDESLESLQDVPQCMLDPWTADFRRHHSGQLGSEAAKADCQAAAQLAHGDTADVERRHASIRRRVMAASCHSHAQRLEVASVEFVVRESIGVAASSQGQCDGRGHGSRRMRSPGDQPDGEEPSAKRGGGAYRAFLHREATGHRGRPEPESERRGGRPCCRASGCHRLTSIASPWHSAIRATPWWSRVWLRLWRITWSRRSARHEGWAWSDMRSTKS